ncbi:MAG: DUF4304 domain-containing protein [Acidobacteria bacterium]|nr:DUF4304 domain-containing protein [Acidobacteriota bacterium]
MTNEVCGKFDFNLKKQLTEILADLGFHKSGSIYTADLGDVIWFIDLQTSNCCAGDHVQLTLNCGVYVRGVWPKFAANSAAEIELPNPKTCTVSARLGMLTPDRIDNWWTSVQCDTESIDAKTWTELRSMIEEILIPFFENFHTPLDVAEFLTRAPDDHSPFIYPLARSIRLAYAGIIYFNLGDAKASKRLLETAVIEELNTFPDSQIVVGLKSRLFAR